MFVCDYIAVMGLEEDHRSQSHFHLIICIKGKNYYQDITIDILTLTSGPRCAYKVSTK